MGDLRHLWTNAFLAHLAECGILTDAAAAAGVDRSTVWRRRQDDLDFAKACDEAIDMAADKLEAEARRRALDGTEEPVYQGGQLVGTKRVYSDSLMALLLKGRRKKVFADRTELTGADGGPVKAQVLVVTGVPSDEIPIEDLV
jgi:nucleotide-binding universal stress UspA family protein